jgi:hypothetical protein
MEESVREYPKIETLLKRDPATHKVVWPGKFRLPEFEYLSGCDWRVSEKVDGTNMRVGWDGESVKIGGRTDNAQIMPKLYEHMENTFKSESAMAMWRDQFNREGTNITLYGEGYGAKIQKGGGNYKADGVSFVLFDVLVGGNLWLDRNAVSAIARYFNVQVVPEIGIGRLRDVASIVPIGMKSQWGDFQSEGVVVRPMVELLDRRGNRIIGKLKTRDF